MVTLDKSDTTLESWFDINTLKEDAPESLEIL